MKQLILLSLLTCSILTSNVNIDSYSKFEYKYQIKTKSYSPLDDAAGYNYKEQMIDKFEYELFTLSEEDHTLYIINNLDHFKLSDDASVSYQMGTICVTIGEGKGKVIKGQFRKNVCDEKVLREKYYIFELFK